MRQQIFKFDVAEEMEMRSCEVEKGIDTWRKNLWGTGYTATKTSTQDIFTFCCKSCGSELYGYVDLGYAADAYVLRCEASRLKESSPRPETIALEDKAYKFLEFEDKVWETGKQEYAKILESCCPVCGAKLCQESGFFIPLDGMVKWHSQLSGIKNLYEVFGTGGEDIYDWDDYGNAKAYEGTFINMAAYREEAEREQANEAMKAYTVACNLPMNAPSGDVSKISKDGELLKKYILHLIQMENSIYSLQRQLVALYSRRPGTERAVVFGTYAPAFAIRGELEEKRIAYRRAEENVRVAEQSQPKVSVNYPVKPTAPVLGTPGFFNKKKVLAENEALTAKYNAEMEVYQQAVQRCDEEKARRIVEMRADAVAKAQKKADFAKAALNEAEVSTERVIKEIQTNPVPARAAKDLLDKEIAETEELLHKTFAARNELYAYEIIFGKYRNVVALSSFYEYLMSGRCSSLDGANGAYDIYESEIRANRVIAQLDTVITSLEEIKQNQYMIHAELCSINSSLDRMNSTLDKALTSIQSMEGNVEHIAKNSDVIAHNTAVTAYYSKINAELTNALGYMVAFK